MDETAAWLRDLVGGVVTAKTNYRYNTAPQLEQAKWMALGDQGYFVEGQAGVKAQPSQGINPTVLLIGAVVVGILMLKD